MQAYGGGLSGPPILGRSTAQVLRLRPTLRVSPNTLSRALELRPRLRGRPNPKPSPRPCAGGGGARGGGGAPAGGRLHRDTRGRAAERGGRAAQPRDGRGAAPVVPSSRPTRRPPSPAAAFHGHPCHSHGPGRFPSPRQRPQPLRTTASPPKAAPRLRICAPTRAQVQRPHAGWPSQRPRRSTRAPPRLRRTRLYTRVCARRPAPAPGHDGAGRQPPDAGRSADPPRPRAVCACVRASCACVRACVRVCVCVRARACGRRARACACVAACVRAGSTCVHACKLCLCEYACVCACVRHLDACGAAACSTHGPLRRDCGLCEDSVCGAWAVVFHG